MNSICFTKGGYHYFLIPNEDGYHRLMTDDVDFALQYLRAVELNGVITSITKGEVKLLTLGQKLKDVDKERVVKEIVRIEGTNSAFKVKLE